MSYDVTGQTWTSAELLEDVRRKARIPAGTLDFTDANLLEEASRAIWSFASWVMSSGGTGRLMNEMQRLSSSAASSFYGPGREFDLPPDAVGDTFDSIFWVDSAGYERRLELIDLATQPLLDSASSQGDGPWGYSVIDGRVRVYPRPVSTGKLRINYQKRLPRLIADDDARTITSQTSDASLIELVYAGGQILFLGDRFDVINPAYPYRFVVTGAEVTAIPVPGTVQSTSYTSATMSASLASLRLVQTGRSPYVHLPLEFKQALTQKIAAQILGEIGDAQGAMLLEQKAEMELGRVITMLSPRSQTTRVKIVNPHSLLRSRRNRRMW